MRIYVQVDSLWTLTSGHLWWRRWSKPREFVILHMLLKSDSQSDSWLWGVGLDNELRAWSEDRFEWAGQQHALTWFNRQRSAALRHTLLLDGV